MCYNDTTYSVIETTKEMNWMEIWLGSIPIIGIMIVALAIIYIWAINKEKKSGFPLQDERTARIQGKVYKTVFYIGVGYLLALNFYNIINIELLGGTELESMPVINSAVLIMSLSAGVLLAYYGRKGDV
jgi:hypothetical protein